MSSHESYANMCSSPKTFEGWLIAWSDIGDIGLHQSDRNSCHLFIRPANHEGTGFVSKSSKDPGTGTGLRNKDELDKERSMAEEIRTFSF